MKLVIFGLTLSSSWGNGHATLWRGLCRALGDRSHRVVFFERDVPYYRVARDLTALEGGELVLYERWEDIEGRARRELADADAAFVTSYCPDALPATARVLEASRSLRVFYDLDTPVTLSSLERGERPAYVGPDGLGGFDLVLSFTGGRALEALSRTLGARRVAPLYGHVDPEVHRPVPPDPRFAASFSYLGTYSADRQQKLGSLFVEPARRAPELRFLLGGSQYPESQRFPENVVHLSHVPPADHPSFFCSSRVTLNVTRGEMARFGYCPSGRLFEAAACGAPIASDWFDGLDCFFDSADEICLVERSQDVLDVLARDDGELQRRAARARARVLDEHRASQRALELERLLEEASAHRRAPETPLEPALPEVRV